MKKIIAFSLWGNEPMYNVGAIKNAELVPEIYGEDWIGRFYIGEDVPQSTRDKLQSLPQIECIYLPDEIPDWTGMFWRFWTVEDDVDYAVFRDTDSRITTRERLAVDEWIDSDKILHIMRDHPYHSEPIMGGMWGCKAKEMIHRINETIYKPSSLTVVSNMKDVISNWLDAELSKTKKQINPRVIKNEHGWRIKGIDQLFLRFLIYPMFVDNSHIQDSYPMYNAWSGRFDVNRETPFEKEINTGFPSQRGGSWDNFVGQVYDENNKPVEEYSTILSQRDTLIYKDF